MPHRITIDFRQTSDKGNLALTMVAKSEGLSIDTTIERNAALAFFRDLRDALYLASNKVEIIKPDKRIKVEYPPHVVARFLRTPSP